MELKDGVNINILTPDCATIISAGTVTMPNALNGDGTYGYDVDLPGIDPISASKIGVVCLPSAQSFTWEATVIAWNVIVLNNAYYYPSFYLEGAGAFSYYTKNDTTGVMSPFTPGIRTAFNVSTWDGIISAFPIVGWDRMAASITSVRLWAAMCYLIADGGSDFKAVYSIGNTGGITLVDYAIFMKEWDY